MRKFLHIIQPEEDGELRLELQHIRDMALDPVKGRSVLTLTEEMKKREQLKASLGIILYDKKNENAAAASPKEHDSGASPGGCWNCSSRDHQLFRWLKERNQETIRAKQKESREESIEDQV